MESPSSIAALSHECVLLFERLCQVFEDKEIQKGFGLSYADVCDAYGQFRIWAGNIGALQDAQSASSLDRRLHAAPRISKQVVALLEDLVETLEDTCAIAAGSRQNRVIAPLASSSAQLRDESDAGKSVSVTSGEIIAPKSEIEECFQSALDTTMRLFKLSILIRNSTTRDRYAKANAAGLTEPFGDSFDIDHVGNKFPRLNEPQNVWLKYRLGKAITQRRQYLRYCREHQERSSKGITAETGFQRTLEKKSISLNLNTELQASVKAPSTFAPTSASTIDPARISEEMLKVEIASDEDKSQTSFASSVVEDGTDQLLSVIPFELVGKPGVPFECPYCRRIVSLKTYSSWQNHVLHDLKPYVCTFEGCDLKMFADRHAWFTHELQVHRVKWHCSSCDTYFKSLQGFKSHMSNFHSYKSTPKDLSALISCSQRSVDEIPANACPFCATWEAKLRSQQRNIRSDETLVVTPAQFRRHVGGHMDQLALFAIPRGYSEELGSTKAAPRHGTINQSEDSLENLEPGYAASEKPWLHVAAFEGLEEEVKRLVDEGFDPFSTGTTWGSALGAAAAGGQLSIAKLLLKNYKGNLLQVEPLLRTPLHWASSIGNLPMVQLLLDSGFDASIRDSEGATAADLASRGSYIEALKLLQRAKSSGLPRDKPQAKPVRMQAQPVRMTAFFIPGDGIDREVITADIVRYLGNDALIRPGAYKDKMTGLETQGYYITAARTLTTRQIDTLKKDSAAWAMEKQQSTYFLAGDAINPKVLELSIARILGSNATVKSGEQRDPQNGTTIHGFSIKANRELTTDEIDEIKLESLERERADQNAAKPQSTKHSTPKATARIWICCNCGEVGMIVISSRDVCPQCDHNRCPNCVIEQVRKRLKK